MTPTFVDADQLVAFLDSLRAAGYRIGAEKYIAAHDLVLALSAEPRETRTAIRLGQLLRPLLCSNAAEQDEFPERFRTWSARIVPDQRTFATAAAPETPATPPSAAPPPAPLAESLASMRRASAAFWAVAAIVGLVIGWAAWSVTRAPDRVTVHIQSEPEGAVVRALEFDPAQGSEIAPGDSLGQTGLEWRDVVSRRYALHFHLPGYRDTSHVITVAGDSVHHVRVALRRTPRGAASFTSTPAGALVALEPLVRDHGSEVIDTGRAGPTPVEFLDLSVGEYRLSASLAGFDPVSETVTIDSGATLSRDITLERTRTGNVRIATEPAGAEILLNDVVADTAPALIERPVGTYRLTVRAAAHHDTTFAITIEAGDVLDLQLPLVPRSSGSMVVQSDPPGGRILIDDVVQQSESGEPIVLLEGNHTVRIELQGYEPFVLDTVVIANATTDVTALLTLLQPPRYRVAFHPVSATLATGDPGRTVVLWNASHTPDSAVAAANLRIRRSGYRDAARPWSVVGQASRMESANAADFERHNDVVASSDRARWIAVASTGPSYRFSGSSIYGDSAAEIRIFDGQGRRPAESAWIPDAGNGILAMRFNGAGDTLFAATRRGRIERFARVPCLTGCASETRWELADAIEIGRPVNAATFETKDQLAFVDVNGFVGRYSIAQGIEVGSARTGNVNLLRLIAHDGLTGIVTDDHAARVLVPGDAEFVAEHRNIASMAFGNAGVTVLGSDSGAVFPAAPPAGEMLPRRHRDAVLHVAVSPDGRILASASADGTLALWDLARERWIGSVWLHRIGTTVMDLAAVGHQRWTAQRRSFSWSDFPSPESDRRQVADYADDVARSPLRTRDALAGELAPAGLAFSPDGNTLIIVTDDGSVRRWDIGFGERPDWRQALLQNVAFSPDSAELVVPGAAGTIEVWDPWLRQMRETLSGHQAQVSSIAYSPDGIHVASGDAKGEVRLWSRTPLLHAWLSAFHPDETAPDVPAAKASPDGPDVQFGPDVQVAHPLAFSPDGLYLASPGDNNELLIWDVEAGSVMRAAASDSSAASHIAFSPDSRRIAAAGEAGGISVIPVTPSEEEVPLHVATPPVRSLVWTSDSTFVAATIAGIRPFVVQTRYTRAGTRVSVVEDASFLAASEWQSDGRAIAFSADGRTMAAWQEAAADTTYDALLTVLRPLPLLDAFRRIDVVGPAQPTAMSLNANGEWIALADVEGRIHVLDRREIQWIASDSRADHSFPWNVDSRSLMLGSVRDSADEQRSARPDGHRGEIQALALSADARLLASASTDSTVMIWDVRRGEPITRAEYVSGAVKSLVFQPGGRRLAALVDDGIIRIWDLGIGIPLRAHTGEVTSLSFSADGRRLATAAADSTVVIWDLWRMVAYDTVRMGSAVESVAFSPAGDRLVAATADSVVHLWNARGSRMATLGEWLEGGSAVVFLVLIGLGTIFVHQSMWRLRASRMLVRQQAEQRPEVHRFALRNAEQHIFPREAMLDLARRLRRRVETVSDALDVPETVARTARRGGIFTAAYLNRQERPEYVALIDRTSLGDQQSAFIDDLLDRLAADDVPIERYYFDGDMRICFPRSQRDRPLHLTAVAQRNAGRRLFIFSDAGVFFDPLTGDPIEWADQLNSWTDRAFLTPEPQQHWTARESRLQAEFAVGTATHNGLLSLTDRQVPSEETTRVGRFPPLLKRRPRRWVERDEPDGAEVATMVAALRDYLDEAGFLWLCACAVYPEMNWRLTVNLGVLLRDDADVPLVNAERLAALARLPWFRHDYMPDWLRNRLLDEMTPEREQQVRIAIEQLLVAAVEGRDDPHDLEIARQQSRTLHSLARSILVVMRRQAQPGDAARDYVFQSFMHGQRSERLAVRLPRSLALLLNGERRKHAPARLVAEARRLQTATLAFVPALAVLLLTGNVAWRNVPEAIVRLGAAEREVAGRSVNADSMLALRPDSTTQLAQSAVPAAEEPDSVASDANPADGPIDRANFFAAYRATFGDLGYEATDGLYELLRFLENDPDMRDVRLRAYILATVKYETGDRYVPQTEPGDASSFQRYEPGTPIGDRLGNKVPGDGERYRGRGYIGITGRENYYRMSQILGFEPKMSDLIDAPDKANDPILAYRIMSIGMRDGLFTGRKLGDYINDERTDYVSAGSVLGSGARNEQVAAYARSFEAILRESSSAAATAAAS